MSLVTTMETLIDSIETPSWSSSAQTASLTNTLTALTLAGVPVTNTTLDNVLTESSECGYGDNRFSRSRSRFHPGDQGIVAHV